MNSQEAKALIIFNERRYDEAKALYTTRKRMGLCVDCGNAINSCTCNEDRVVNRGIDRNSMEHDKRIIELVKLIKTEDDSIRPTKRDDSIRATKRKISEKEWYMVKAGEHTGSKENWREIKEILIKQDYRCAYTGVKLVIGVNASIDHIVPRCKGGKDTVDNIQWVDKIVNSEKGRRTSKVYKKELISGDTYEVRKQRKAAEACASFYEDLDRLIAVNAKKTTSVILPSKNRE